MSEHKLVIDEDRRLAIFDGQVLNLTRLSYETLAMLARNPYAPHDRRDLIRGVWNNSVPPDSRAVDAKVTQLRERLGHGLLRKRQGYGWTLAQSPEMLEVEFVQAMKLVVSHDDPLEHVERAFELALKYVRRARRGATNDE